MVSEPFGSGFALSLAAERSVRVNGVSLVFPNMSLLRAMVDCHSSVTYPRRLRLCMRYASSRLLFDFSTPFRLQSNKLLVIFGETLVVKSLTSLMQSVSISICSSEKSDLKGLISLPTIIGFSFDGLGSMLS